MLTFEQLPETVSLMKDDIKLILSLLQNKKVESSTTQDDLLVIKQAAEFLHLSLPTIYSLVSNRKIPFMKKSQRLYFSKKSLTAWLQETRRVAA